MSRGYFEIGIFGGKSAVNVGTLWRSAFQLGAAGIFTIGARYGHQSSNTTESERHIPLREFNSFDEFLLAQPHGAMLVAVEMGGKDLQEFRHPPRAIYLLGAEDHGLPPKVLARCQAHTSIPALRMASYNVAIAGSLVMYDRMVSA